MNNTIAAKRRRQIKTRKHIKRLGVPRLSVNRTGKHTYASLIDPITGNVIAQASTVEKAISGDISNGSNIAAATKVGSLVAKRAIEKGLKKVAFDRSGFKYHGRVAALAAAAREEGLDF